MKLTLSNGVTVEGTLPQIEAVAKAFGLQVPVDDGIHYASTTRGVVKISEMSTQHLVNAIRKIYRLNADNLPTDPAKLLETLRSNNTVTLLALVRELASRWK